MIQFIFTSAAAVLLISFLIWAYRKYGITPSFSHLYYEMEKEYDWRLFPFIIYLFILLIFAGGHSLTIVLSCLALSYVPAAAHFKDIRQTKYHYIGAYAGIMGGVASYYIDLKMWIPIVIFLAGYFTIRWLKPVNTKAQNTSTYWVEAWAFLVVMIRLFL